MPSPKAPVFLSIKNFERFQHYKTRNPPWIRLYYAILDDPAFLALDEVSQCRLMKLFLIASKQSNAIPNDPAYISKMLRLNCEVDLTPLINSGFVLATRKQRASNPQAKPSLISDSSEADTSEGEKSAPADPLYPDELKTKTNGHATPEILPSGFEEFWIAYPNKTGKVAAVKAWKKCKHKPPLETILSSITTAKQSRKWKDDGGRFIPNPATWLNEGRWDDKPPEIPKPERRLVL